MPERDSALKRCNDKIKVQNKQILDLVSQIKACNSAYQKQAKAIEKLKEAVSKKKKAESLRTIALLKQQNKKLMSSLKK